MPSSGSSANIVISAVRKFARPDPNGGRSVDVSVVSSATGLSNTEIVEQVQKLQKFDAPLQLDLDKLTIQSD